MFATQVYEAKNLTLILMEMYEAEMKSLRAGPAGVACVLERSALLSSLMATIYDKLKTIHEAMDKEEEA